MWEPPCAASRPPCPPPRHAIASRWTLPNSRARLAGEQSTGGEDVITASKLFLVAADGAWHLPIAGVEWGADPRLSRFGSYIAYTDADGNAHAGQLQLR